MVETRSRGRRPNDASTMRSGMVDARVRALARTHASTHPNANDGGEGPPDIPPERVVITLPVAVTEGPDPPDHMKPFSYGIVTGQKNPLVCILRSTEVQPVLQQHSVCEAFSIDFAPVLYALLRCDALRELVLFTDRVVWFALSQGTQHMFAIDITDWCLPGGVRVVETAMVGSMRCSKTRPFDTLMEAIEDCDRSLSSQQYKSLYDAAMRLYVAHQGTR